MPNIIKSGNALSPIKSVQSGLILINGTATTENTRTVTVNAVDVNSSILIVSISARGTTPGQAMAAGRIASATSLTLRCSTSVKSDASSYVSWQLIEFNNVKSLQSGIFQFGPSVSGTQTINAIDLNKSFLTFSHYTQADNFTPGEVLMTGQITSTTQIQFVRDDSIGTGKVDTVYWFVVEFN